VTHLVDLVKHTHQLVHHLTLPIGPNIEGIHIHRNQLHVYGFSSKKFVLYNTVTEEEVMSVETGGAHRTWSFNPTLQDRDGGTLVWTRASSMHTFSQREPNHTVIRSGGHGREIKAVAVSRPASMQESGMQLIATGAEDTDIKIFTYANEHLVCLRTLRRHTTGIQCLQWSTDGSYLFSSGGCEEFYIWKISRLPPELGSIGVVCEAVWSPESEHSDLRIMAFDVAQKADHAFVISMVFSNSTVKVDIDNRVLVKGTNHLCRSTTLILRGQTDGRRWQRAYTLLPVSPNAYLSIHPKWKYLIPSSQLEQTAMLCFGP
jgi:WD40 repeat protein